MTSDLRRQTRKQPISRALRRIWQPLLDRTDLLNFLAELHGCSRYLEIGTRDPQDNFDHVRVSFKHSVDPQPRGTVTHRMTSDEFFTQLPSDGSALYDLVLIDGLHLADQVERDVIHALQHLSQDGRIVLHDCNPQTADAQTDDYDGKKLWNGTVWKAWMRLRATRRDLSMCVIAMDHGCGVIRRGAQVPYTVPTLEYDQMSFEWLQRERKAALNLVSPRQFKLAEEALVSSHRDAQRA